MPRFMRSMSGIVAWKLLWLDLSYAGVSVGRFLNTDNGTAQIASGKGGKKQTGRTRRNTADT
jgi:hypothetical protein